MINVDKKGPWKDRAICFGNLFPLCVCYLSQQKIKRPWSPILRKQRCVTWPLIIKTKELTFKILTWSWLLGLEGGLSLRWPCLVGLSRLVHTCRKRTGSDLQRLRVLSLTSIDPPREGGFVRAMPLYPICWLAETGEKKAGCMHIVLWHMKNSFSAHFKEKFWSYIFLVTENNYCMYNSLLVAMVHRKKDFLMGRGRGREVWKRICRNRALSFVFNR